MSSELNTLLRECAEGSLRGTLTFPEVVGRLVAANVERYHADYSRGEITYYLPSGASEVVPLPQMVRPVANDFSAEGVQAAVRAAQAGEIRFPEFVDRSAAAGCVGYFAQISGRRVIYFGRKGESHVELFPGTK